MSCDILLLMLLVKPSDEVGQRKFLNVSCNPFYDGDKSCCSCFAGNNSFSGAVAYPL